MAIRYTPPTPEDLRSLQQRMGCTGSQMADLFGLAGSNQWRKYVTGHSMRPMSLSMLFLAMALLNRSATVEQVFDLCRQAGAKIEEE